MKREEDAYGAMMLRRARRSRHAGDRRARRRLHRGIELPRDVHGTVSPLARTQPAGYALRPWPCARRRVRRRTGLPSPSGARPRRRGHRHLARRRRGVPPARRSRCPRLPDRGRRRDRSACSTRSSCSGTTSASSQARAKARRLLRRFHDAHERPRPDRRRDARHLPDTEDPVHLAYHERNRSRGRHRPARSGCASATASSRRRGSTTSWCRPTSWRKARSPTPVSAL